MDLLVAFKNDSAGHNMANFISRDMNKDGDIFRGKNFDLIEIDSPAISADWLDEKYDYDGFVFLSKSCPADKSPASIRLPLNDGVAVKIIPIFFPSSKIKSPINSALFSGLK